MTDITGQVNATSRTVGTAGEGHRVLLRRNYDAPPGEVWDACTSPERIARWLAPVTGDLRPGGSYQLEGNAGGSILRCEPPRLLKVSWIFGEGPPSQVELRLSAADSGGTLLELEHSGWSDGGLLDRFGPGAVGVGWDLALLGLSMHLAGRARPDPAGWLTSAPGREFITRSSSAWAAAFQAAGATAAQAAEAARHTTAFYAPPGEEHHMPATAAQKITTFLMFQGTAEEAMTFYTSLFSDGEILSVTRYGAGEAGTEGTVQHATFTIAGQEFRCIDSSVEHGFAFTPAMSLYVQCQTQDEIDRLYAALSEGGQPLMPLGAYDFSAKFGWVADRFGVSWQLNLGS